MALPRIDSRMHAAPAADDLVLTIWEWCSAAYLRHGRKLTFPANTEPRKTYQWRFARAIAAKFADWNFDDDTAKRFIDIAVAYAIDIGVAHKGLAVLHQANMLEICYERLRGEADSGQQSLTMLEHMHKWLLAKCGDGDPVTVLLQRAVHDGLCNLVVWCQASQLSPLYLALSRRCSRALARLTIDHPSERALLPSSAELFLLRDEFLRNANNLTKAKAIFTADWRHACLLPY